MLDPQFADFAARDFRLKLSSPLINAGALLSNVPNDFDEKARPLGVTHDIGAFELF
jgi:hypothetical protein